jgi:Ceramidase
VNQANTYPTYRWIVARILGLLGLSTVAVFLLRYVPYSWASWPATNCWPVCFCEAARESFVRQPVNTLSNLAFILVGVLIVGTMTAKSFRAEGPNLLSRVAGYRLTFGFGILAIGLCSIFYHSSLTALGQWFDWLGIYIFFAFIIFYSFTRLLPLPHWLFAVAYGLTVLGLSVYTYFRIDWRLQIFGDLLWIALVLEGLVRIIRRPKMKSIYLIGALISLWVGRYAAVSMGEGSLCVPTSWVQGHAIWHVLTALTTGLLYLYFSSETVRVKSDTARYQSRSKLGLGKS